VEDSAEVPGVHQPVILVVEDSPLLRAQVCTTLAAPPLCAKVVAAPNGAVGLGVALRDELDCVVCDLEMPVMDGMTFLRALRQYKSMLELPVLLLSASQAVEDKVAAFRLGASDFVPKPIQPEELVARAQTHVRVATMHRQLAAEAHRDPLTGLANRRRFQEVLRAEMARVQRSGQAVSLVLLDVDHFKHVNDTHGHPAGDAVLVGVARVLVAGTRAYDLPARVGGEEFAVLLPQTTLDRAHQVAERIRVAMASASLLPGAADSVTVSLGVAQSQTVGDSPSALLARADAQLYRAKRSGRNLVCSQEAPWPDLISSRPAHPRANAPTEAAHRGA
jgi:diguanylate cyclase (GGDEF)-like protein